MGRGITATGLDVALSNTGVAHAVITKKGGKFVIDVSGIETIRTKKTDQKQVRVASDNLSRATELKEGMREATQKAAVVFAEVPSGSQSAKASHALGIAVGVLALIDKPLIQVTQQEVKLASVGSKTASKMDIIEWAYELYPDLNWKYHKNVLSSSNEHMADAIATLYAGIKSPQFQTAYEILLFT